MARNSLNYLSICSGIEAATAAWHALGWKPVGFSEIESFARAVLTHHYPDVPLHGDFTAIRDIAHGTVDLLVGGTPCQSFSIAGLRKGLDDDRGNLTLEYIRLAERTRPRWLVWENVPGVLSIDGGRAFGSFLGGLAECGYGFAYRVLDAQYFGVPQRRRRVFVVGYLGDWRPAAAVLFERESLRGDITPRRETRSAVAALTARGVGTSGADDNQGQAGHLIAHTLRGDGFDASEDGSGRGVPLLAFGGNNTSGSIDVAAGLNAKSTQRQDFETETLIAIPLQEVGKRTGKSTDDSSIGLGIGNEGDAMFTLQSAAQHGVAIPIDLRNAGRDPEKHDEVNRQGCGIGAVGDPMTTLSTAFVPGVASFKPGQSSSARGIGYEVETAPSLEAGGGGNNKPAIMQYMAVRRLTPRECERLQGFPDDYTLIPYRGKPAADGPRYKALGNSMAVPVMRWLGERIQKIDGLINLPAD